MNQHLCATGRRAGVFFLAIALFATPALSQGTGGGAGGESGSSSALPQQQRIASAHIRARASSVSPEYRVFCCDTVRNYTRYGRYTWADMQGTRLMVRMP
jgi:hypothetical protein